jgi:hypothetical protein
MTYWFFIITAITNEHLSFYLYFEMCWWETELQYAGNVNFEAKPTKTQKCEAESLNHTGK